MLATKLWIVMVSANETKSIFELWWYLKPDSKVANLNYWSSILRYVLVRSVNVTEKQHYPRFAFLGRWNGVTSASRAGSALGFPVEQAWHMPSSGTNDPFVRSK